MIDDETLHAYLDGELPPAEAVWVEEALAGDPALAEKLAQQHALRERLRAAFDPVAEEPAPAELAAMIPSAHVVDLAKARADRKGNRLPQWAAIAATLVAGLAGGYAIRPGPGQSIVERNGTFIAAGPIADALENQLASERQPTGPVHVRLTFRDGGGAICRSFASPEVAGVACREQAGWAMRAMVAGHGEKPGPYRTASTGDATLMAYVDSIRAGDPFDAEAESEAKRSGWSNRPGT